MAAVSALAPPGVPAGRAPLVGAAAATAVAVGMAALLVGYFGAASSTDTEDQTSWGVLAVAGTGLICLTATLWLAAGRLAVARRSHTVTAALATRLPRPVPTVVDGTPADRLVASDAMVHYHHTGCALAAGKAVQAAGRDHHERAGRTPCGVCRP